MSKIRGVFGYELVSKSFIHWLSKYKHAFLGCACCPTLPYQSEVNAQIGLASSYNMVSRVSINQSASGIDDVQYTCISKGTQTDRALLYFYPYLLGLIHCHWDCRAINLVPV